VLFSAVLDANALYPFSLRDSLLRLAELELYTPLWSERILEEMRRNLAEHRISDEQAARIVAAMRAAFEEAEVDPDEITRLEPAMTNEPNDRHVLAAAVAAGSEVVVTFNLADFPAEACEPLGVEAIHPDQFLLDLHDLHPETVHAALERQATDLTPPWPLDSLLDALETAGVPRFAAAVRFTTGDADPPAA
jgi:predicted nucleic acid-binding protein